MVGRPSKRDELLAAAMAVVAAQGSRGASLAAVAEQAGMTAPAVTHHFGSKQGLLLAIVDELDRRDSAAANERDVSGLDLLRVIGRWTQRVVDDPASARLAHLRAMLAVEAIDERAPAHDRFVERNRRLRAPVVDCIRAGQADGSIRPDVDADAIATEILGAFQGAQIQWLMDPDGVDLVAVVDRYVDRLVRDLTTHTASPNATAEPSGAP